MLRTRSRKIAIMALACVINVTAGTVASRYVIRYWTEKMEGVPVVLSWPVSALAGLVLGEIAVPAGVVTGIVDRATPHRPIS